MTTGVVSVSIRPSATFIVSALAASLLAPATRADEVPSHFTGKVILIQTGTPETAAALAGLGVVDGASVSIDFSVDSTARGVLVAGQMMYDNAVLSGSMTIGRYVAQINHGVPAYFDQVNVSNDVADGYTLFGLGTDTDAILRGPLPENMLSLTVSLADPTGSALSSYGIAQDLSGFPIGGAILNGIQGAIGIALDASPGGPAGVPSHFTGKVSSIQTGTETAASLSALGVVNGTPASIDFSVDPAAQGDLVNGLMIYDGGVLSCSVTIGLYVAQVSDEVPVPFDEVDVTHEPWADSYTVVGAGTDTDTLLRGPLPADQLSLSVGLVDDDGGTLSSHGIAQDLSKFPAGSVMINGTQGQIVILLDLSSGGPGGSGVGGELARRGQMLAASKLGRALLKTSATFAAAPPEKDPLGIKQEALVAQAHEIFLVQFVKAIDKAVKKGGSAPLPSDMKEAAAASIESGCHGVIEMLMADAAPLVKADRSLRGKLLGAASKQLKLDLGAHARDVLNPEPEVLAARLASSRAKLIAAVEKALDKANAQGVPTMGPTGDAVADAVTAIVDGFVELTLGTD